MTTGLKPQGGSHALVKGAKRIRIFQFVDTADRIAFTHADRARQTRTIAINRHNQGALEAAGEIRTGCMRQMVIEPLELTIQVQFAQMLTQVVLPAPVAVSRFLTPQLRTLTCHAPREHTFGACETIEYLVREGLFDLLIRMTQAGNPLGTCRHFRQCRVKLCAHGPERSFVEELLFGEEILGKKLRFLLPIKKGISYKVDILREDARGLEAGMQSLGWEPSL